MKILFKDGSCNRLVYAHSIRVSNNAPYSVRFYVGFKKYELFTSEVEFYKAINPFINDVVDLRGWYSVSNKVLPDDLITYYHPLGDFLKNNSFANPYPRLVKCIKSNMKVECYFPVELLQDIKDTQQTIEVSDVVDSEVL